MSSYRLLISGPPLQVLPTLAVHVGLNEAIVLQQIHYWISRESAKVIGGRPWVYNTFQQWKSQFPFWSEKTIRRTLASLQEKNLIVAENHNANKFDQTKWYTLNYDALSDLEKSMQAPSGESRANPSGQNDHIEETPNKTRSGQSDHIELPKGEIDVDNVTTSQLDKMTTSDLDKMTTSYKEQRITIDSQKGDARAEKISEEVLMEIWNRTVAPKNPPISLTPKRKKRLLTMFENVLNGDISAWEAYCLTIAKTPFLMGQTDRSDWKVTLDWALEADNLQKVREGAYGVTQKKGEDFAGICSHLGVSGGSQNTHMGDENEITAEDLHALEKSILERIQGNKSTSTAFKETLENILKEIGPQKYATWFRDIKEGRDDTGEIILVAPNAFIRDYICDNFKFISSPITL